MNRFLLALSVALMFPACAAQIKVKTPSLTNVSPEALGGFGNFELGGGAMGTPAIEVTSDGANRAPDQTTPKVIRDDRFFTQAGMGLLPRLDLHFDPGGFASLKLQLLGKPYKEAKRGNFSLSLIGGYAWKDEDGRGSDLDFSKDKGISISPDIRYTLHASQWRGGLLLGYRVSDSLLLYGGGSHSENRYSGGFDNVSGRDGRYSGFSEARSAIAGIEFSFGKAFLVRVEDAYTVTKIPSASARSSDHFYGLYLAGLLPN